MDNMQEKVEYGKKEVKDVEGNVNEVVTSPKDAQPLEPKIKVKKTDKFSKEEGLRESI